MKPYTRRSFLKGAALTAGITAAFPRNVLSQVLGANDAIRIAVIGVRGKGSDHVATFQRLPDARVVALCDADREVLDQEHQKLVKLGGQADRYIDARQLLDRKDIDAVAIATPNHWHALMAVWACQAGKDVYVEKPVSHDLWEGRKIVEAARKYRRIVQAGTQSRTDPALQEAFAALRSGALGRIRLVRGFCYKRRKSIGKVNGPQPVPASVDYNLWAGPAPMEPLLRQSLHYDWHWVWPTGNGDIGNQGIHELDMCRWAAGHEGIAPGAISFGGRLGYDDDGRTPNTQIAYFDYRPVPILFEVRGLPMGKDEEGEAMDHFKSVRIGVVVECENGYFAGGAGGGSFFDHQGKKLKQFTGPGGRDHQKNFLQAVRSRRVSDLNADVEKCHISCALFHMANISYRLGRKCSPGEVLDHLRGNPDLNESFERMKTHLAANEVRLDGAALTLGPWLRTKPTKERFVGDFAKQANAYLKREYRKPFFIPEKV